MKVSDLRSYVFLADTSQKSFDEIISTLDRMSEISNWYKFMPSAAVLVSREPLGRLKDRLRAELPGQRFLVVLAESGKQNGWLPKRAWELMNSPEPVT